MRKGRAGLGLKLEIELEVRGKNGKLINKRRVKANSWLRNFALAFRVLLFCARAQLNVTTTVVNVGGASATFRASSVNASKLTPLATRAPSGNDDYGIQVGTGTTPVTRDDYCLVSKIPHGTATGQMVYGAVTVEDVDGVPPESRFRIIRVFSNESGADITVNEIGLVANNYAFYDAVTAEVYFMLARDVLPSPVTVPVGATLTVRYIVSVTA